jgi:hypothetical protein
MKAAILSAAVLLASAPAIANEDLEKKSYEVANAFVDCAALYAVMSEGTDPDKPATAKWFKEISNGSWLSALYVVAQAQAALGSVHPLGYYEPRFSGRLAAEITHIKMLIEQDDPLTSQIEICNKLQQHQVEIIRNIRENRTGSQPSPTI